MMCHSSNLINAALKAKSHMNGSKSRNSCNCIWIDLKLGNLPPTIQKRNSQYVFSTVTATLENIYFLTKLSFCRKHFQ